MNKDVSITKIIQKSSRNVQKLSRNVQKLLFLVWFLIPFIPLALLLKWLNPVGFWQSITMFGVCGIIYVALLLVELAFALFISDSF